MARAFSLNILQLNIYLELTTNQTIVKDQFDFRLVFSILLKSIFNIKELSYITHLYSKAIVVSCIKTELEK